MTTPWWPPPRAGLDGPNVGIVLHDTGFPRMRGRSSPPAATVAEPRRAPGYATYAAGKWHPAPMEECSAAGPQRVAFRILSRADAAEVAAIARTEPAKE